MTTPGYFFMNFFWLLFMLLVHLLAYFCFSKQVPLCHYDEAFALLHFKESLSIDINACAYSKVASWKLGREAGDCCSWDGVECDNITGHVIGLDLSSCCLYGSINSSNTLFSLFHIKSLNLSGNNFCLSKIPSDISNLSRLTHLNLSFSNFSDQIPSKVLHLFNLVSLDLSYNPLKLQKPGLRDLVETLSSLKYLNLNGVMISSQLPRSLANLTSLSTLLLRNCSLYGEFPVGIFQLPNLHILNVRFNPDLTGFLPGFKVGSPLELLRLDGTSFYGQLPETIGNLRSLNSFVVRGCYFSGPIPSSIGNLNKLEVLDISYNYFSGPIPLSFGNLFQLTSLSLYSNNFSLNSLSWLSNLTNLKFLYLMENNLYGDIPSSLRNLTQLTELWLLSNKLSGQIPSWLGNFTQLTHLLLGDNQFYGPIPESIFQLPNLQSLHLDDNNLNGTLRCDLFLKSKSLVDLQISNNHLSLVTNHVDVNNVIPKFIALGLSSCNLSEFPAFLRGQDQLIFLELSGNKIEVPSWISNLSTKNLKALAMSSNLLTGFEQPLTFLPWTNLCVFDLSCNKFQGSLPIPPASICAYLASNNIFTGEISQLICGMTATLAIDLSYNNLTGQIPPCLSNLSSSLSVLNLGKNSFSGNIPEICRTGCTLRMIDFSQNKLEGKIPRSLANCAKLEYLNLGKNHIHDFFPFWLGVLPELKVLVLKSNKLHGTMTKSQTNFDFSGLQIIDISDNNLIGKLLVAYFEKWNGMKSINDQQLKYMETIPSFPSIDGNKLSGNFLYKLAMQNKGIVTEYERILEFLVAIDLSNNLFEGEIPRVIGSLKGLHSLNLSNNNLTGQIPSSLVNLKKLESLDLSKNKLSGQIPTQLAQLTFLAFLNLSNNCLEGPIPRGRQLDTFQNNSYSANSGLCGYPLSDQCADTKNALPPLPHSNVEQDGGSDSPFEFGWKVVLIGYASGFVIGVIIERTMSWKKNKWLIKIYARMQLGCQNHQDQVLESLTIIIQDLLVSPEVNWVSRAFENFDVFLIHVNIWCKIYICIILSLRLLISENFSKYLGYFLTCVSEITGTYE